MKVLIVDDHRIVREGLRLLLAHEPGIDAVAEATSAEEMFETLDGGDYDVVLLDLRMPGLSGLEALERIRGERPDVKVLVLTMLDDPIYVRRAIELGAKGYLLKSVGRDEILRALECVGSGQAYVQGELTGTLVDIAKNTSRCMDEIGMEDRRLLEYLAAGLDNRRIAEEIDASEAAVKARLRSLYDALGVHTRSEAVAAALRGGLIS